MCNMKHLRGGYWEIIDLSNELTGGDIICLYNKLAYSQVNS